MLNHEYWGFIKDPIHGYIRITDSERSIIDTRTVQRLRRIRQLGPGAEYVYPGANHTRFEHSLGCLYLGGILAENLPVRLNAREIRDVRIATLLHDVGHGPFSHVFEPLLNKCTGKTHEDMAEWLIEKSELAEILEKENYEVDKIKRLAVGRTETKKNFLNQIIRSAVDVDKMDFLLRDSYHTGAEYGQIDIFRLIYTMNVLDSNLAVDLTALPTLEAFIIARIGAFRAVYFHRTVRAYQIMMERALRAANEELGFADTKSIQDYLDLDDYSMWIKLKECPKSRNIMKDLERRKLLKCSFEGSFFAKDPLAISLLTNESIRQRLEEQIAEKTKIEPEKVTLDVPSVPSVPYYHSLSTEPMDIPVFYKTRDGKRIPKKLSEVSRIIEPLQVFMNIVRVYTDEEHRERVAKSAREVLSDLPISAEVSY
ncbi:MAG: HD domain-containing protein [Candidatus Bathyarchaeota archaeon]|nr:MAG: HD domain-containing protein [Candidatus Bathyarchaeota archaeon]